MNLFYKLFSLFFFTTTNSQLNICDNCINRQTRGENIDCTNTCQGKITHLTDCLQYTRCLYDYDLHKVHNICICQKVECNYEYVCPHSEIIHYNNQNIEGYTVYELSLEMKNPNSNIYAIYGDQENNMIIPSAYQLPNHQGADIGGINPLLINYLPDTKYDSWLTIGLTDGNPIGKVDAIGIDFSSWDIYNDLVVTDGAIFLDDPLQKISNTKKYIIAHLTLNDRQEHYMVINVNGKIDINNPSGLNFRELNVTFNFPQKIYSQ